MALNASTTSTTANISSTATYKLVNSWSLGSLAIEPGRPDLQLYATPDNSTAALEFQFRSSDASGSFNLCAAVEDQTYCLDVFNVQKEVPHLTPFGYYAGQYWTVEPADDGNGTVRLSNEWTGAGWYMDLYEGSYEAFMSEGEDYAGHYWWLEMVAEGVALPPNAPTKSVSFKHTLIQMSVSGSRSFYNTFRSIKM
ncbi:putative carbohydrate-binding module family 13 protein [Diplodia seriata]|uniref:Putative carbohydrate-binding module family 13 protein n=1 Tax=Diplodia seriata TaxID=420778 RepID=A0A0G2EUS7_9PEZI|nr:putative carbohydrate-binding module family 13 protein [Diplodia seriata]